MTPHLFYSQGGPESDVWWGEDGIDAGLGLQPAPYEYPITDEKED
jgi:hypothetical protein